MIVIFPEKYYYIFPVTFPEKLEKLPEKLKKLPEKFEKISARQKMLQNCNSRHYNSTCDHTIIQWCISQFVGDLCILCGNRKHTFLENYRKYWKIFCSTLLRLFTTKLFIRQLYIRLCDYDLLIMTNWLRLFN